MPFCSNCGTEVPTSANFCGACGRELAMGRAGVETVPLGTAEAPQILPYHISSTRVLLMSVLSSGLYLFYWFYVTWKQYRDHTRTKAYPVWHVLTLSVPIYGLFRTHAHMRSFKELMLKAGLPNTISPGWAVVLVLISFALDWASFLGSLGQVTRETNMLSFILNVISIALIAGLLVQTQGNLNRYWASLGNVRLTNARVGIGEVVLGVIGVLTWIVTLLSLLTST